MKLLRRPRRNCNHCNLLQELYLLIRRKGSRKHEDVPRILLSMLTIHASQHPLRLSSGMDVVHDHTKRTNVLQSIICHSCGKTGHFAKYCRTRTSTSRVFTQLMKQGTLLSLSCIISGGHNALPSKTVTVYVTEVIPQLGTPSPTIMLLVQSGKHTGYVE